ncbi:momilactone A synthase [Selaginella moellendorffii]|uniref:momilactone A synthase n=1 Tax=Selaginella moellendorffii TaxID=88036 RepID=UPI000D1C556C|nr:momilactone A synthase [Selaginella moellendorffii]|eukprot:XP_024535589.1 momilactone A synthase [Selaginella moellendorffii]
MIRSSWNGAGRRGVASKDRIFQIIRSLATSTQKQRLLGKVAIITGGANGIGDATVRHFVAHGAQVVIADVQDELGSHLARELQRDFSSPTAARYVHCDVTAEPDVAAALDVAHSIAGHVDVVFSNAGILGALGPLDQTDVAELERTMHVNLRGHFLALKHAARVMKPRAAGSIILTGSVAGIVGGLSPHAYAMCKAGVIGLVRSSAVELREFGIRVNVISPDAIPTKFLSTALETMGDLPVTAEKVVEIVKKNSLLPNRPLCALDIANAALFLAGDESGYVSGHNLVVDASNTVTKPAIMHTWFTTYAPMLQEAGKRGLT